MKKYVSTSFQCLSSKCTKIGHFLTIKGILFCVKKRIRTKQELSRKSSVVLVLENVETKKMMGISLSELKELNGSVEFHKKKNPQQVEKFDLDETLLSQLFDDSSEELVTPIDKVVPAKAIPAKTVPAKDSFRAIGKNIQETILRASRFLEGGDHAGMIDALLED